MSIRSYNNLPPEVIENIFVHLSLYDRMRLERVCSRWQEISDAMWVDVKAVDGETLCLSRVATKGSDTGDECMAVHQALEAVCKRAERNLIDALRLTDPLTFLPSTTNFPCLETLVVDAQAHINWSGLHRLRSYGAAGSKADPEEETVGDANQCSTGWHVKVPENNTQAWSQAVGLGLQRTMSSVHRLCLSRYPPLNEYSRLAMTFPSLTHLYLDFAWPCEAHFVGFISSLRVLRWSLSHIALSWSITAFLLEQDLTDLARMQLPRLEVLCLQKAKLRGGETPGAPATFEPLLMSRIWPRLSQLCLIQCDNIRSLQELIDEPYVADENPNRPVSRILLQVSQLLADLPLVLNPSGRVKGIVQSKWSDVKRLFWT